MNSTNVHSEDNQIEKEEKNNRKSEMVMTATQIKGKQNENNFEMIAGNNARAGVIDYIQKQLGPELKAEDGSLRQDGILVTKNGNLAMKSKDAYKKVMNNQTKRKGKIALTHSTNSPEKNEANTSIGR